MVSASKLNLLLVFCLSLGSLSYMQTSEATMSLPSAIAVICLLIYIGYRVTDILLEEVEIAKKIPLTICFMIAVVYANFLFITGVGILLHLSTPFTRPFLTGILVVEAVTLALVSPANISLPDRPPITPASKGLAVLILLTITAFMVSFTVASRESAYPQAPGYLFFVCIGLIGPYLLLTYQSKIADSVGLLTAGVLLPLSNTISVGTLVGRDIHREYYYSSLVLANQQWDPSIAQSFNSVLPTVALTPTLTALLPIDLSTTLQVVYPFFMGTLTLAVYLYSESRYGRPAGITAASIFAYLFPYYFGLTTQPRQQITLLFLGAFLLCFSPIGRSKRSRLGALLLFVCAVVSHYATAILFLIWVLGGVVSLRCYRYLHRAVTTASADIRLPEINRKGTTRSVSYILIGGGLLFVWYGNISSGIFLDNLILLIFETVRSLADILFGTQTSTISRSVSGGSTSLFRTVTKFLYFGVLFATGVGSLVYGYLVINRKSIDMDDAQLYLFGVCAVGFMAVSVVFPDFDLELSRLLQISFLVVGAFAWYGFDLGCALVRRVRVNVSTAGVVSVFLFIFLIFGSGVVYEATGSSPNNAVLSQHSIHDESDYEKYQYYNFYTVQPEDARAGVWYRNHVPDETTVYATGTGYKPFEGYGMAGPKVITYHGNSAESKQLTSDIRINNDAVVYKSYLNTREGIYTIRRATQPLEIKNFGQLESQFRPLGKVYTTGSTSLHRS